MVGKTDEAREQDSLAQHTPAGGNDDTSKDDFDIVERNKKEFFYPSLRQLAFADGPVQQRAIATAIGCHDKSVSDALDPLLGTSLFKGDLTKKSYGPVTKPSMVTYELTGVTRELFQQLFRLLDLLKVKENPKKFFKSLQMLEDPADLFRSLFPKEATPKLLASIRARKNPMQVSSQTMQAGSHE